MNGEQNACFHPGAIVWAKLDGYPWWPAMVERDPVGDDFVWTEEGIEEATHYNVVFLDDKVSRSWIRPQRIRRFTGYENLDLVGPLIYGEIDYSHKVILAFFRGQEALKMKATERVAKYGFKHRSQETGIHDWNESESNTSDETVIFEADNSNCSKEFIVFSNTIACEESNSQTNEKEPQNNDEDVSQKKKKTVVANGERKRVKHQNETSSNERQSEQKPQETKKNGRPIEEYECSAKKGRKRRQEDKSRLFKKIFGRVQKNVLQNKDLLEKIDGTRRKKKR